MALGKRNRERQLEAFVSASDHSSISKTHKRLPKEVFDEVFQFILRVAGRKGLLWGEKLGIDSTTIQANASMKSIVRKDSGKGWKDYTKKLAKKAGLEDPTDAELRQFDRKRPGKKVSNDDWEDPNDPDARITRMKNGTTRMAYKAEHALDLETDLIVSATVHPGNAADTATVIDTAIDAAVNLEEAGCDSEAQAIVADKGYHSTKVLTLADELGMKTYIPEPETKTRRNWVGKDPSERTAVYAARRRTKGEYGKLLSRTRSELVERSFAHVCDTGGARRTWLRGLESVSKRHLMVAAARNLSTIMRVLCGIGCPKALQGLRALLQLAWTHFGRVISALKDILMRLGRAPRWGDRAVQRGVNATSPFTKTRLSTGCQTRALRESSHPCIWRLIRVRQADEHVAGPADRPLRQPHGSSCGDHV